MFLEQARLIFRFATSFSWQPRHFCRRDRLNRQFSFTPSEPFADNALNLAVLCSIQYNYVGVIKSLLLEDTQIRSTDYSQKIGNLR